MCTFSSAIRFGARYARIVPGSEELLEAGYPRRGDIEDDASSSKRRSLLSLAGSPLAEISLPKLVVAFTLVVVLPGLALGIAPIVVAIWFGKLEIKLAS